MMGCTLAFLLGTCAGPAARLVPADTLRLAEAVALARGANPGLIGARLLAEAMSERVAPAGALPDPQIRLALINRPLPSFGTGERMTMNEIQVSQTFPWPGKQHFSRERALLLASAEALSADEAEAQLVAQVKARYFELAYLDRAIPILERTRGLLRDFFQVSQARYAVGDGIQQDVLQAQVAVAQTTEDLVVITQSRVATAGRLNALLGREAGTPIVAVELPALEDALPPADSLAGLATARRPAILAADRRAEAAAAGLRVARRESYPDLMIGLAYGQRPQFDDMGTFMFGFSLPIWAGKRQAPLRREAAALQASEEASARDLRNQTQAELTELRAEAARARELARLYATSIVPQARAAVESALAAYRVGRVDYMTLVESEMTVNRYEIESVRLAAAFHQAAARIEALLGLEGRAP